MAASIHRLCQGPSRDGVSVTARGASRPGRAGQAFVPARSVDARFQRLLCSHSGLFAGRVVIPVFVGRRPLAGLALGLRPEMAAAGATARRPERVPARTATGARLGRRTYPARAGPGLPSAARAMDVRLSLHGHQARSAGRPGDTPRAGTRAGVRAITAPRSVRPPCQLLSLYPVRKIQPMASRQATRKPAIAARLAATPTSARS